MTHIRCFLRQLTTSSLPATNGLQGTSFYMHKCYPTPPKKAEFPVSFWRLLVSPFPRIAPWQDSPSHPHKSGLKGRERPALIPAGAPSQGTLRLPSRSCPCALPPQGEAMQPTQLSLCMHLCHRANTVLTEADRAKHLHTGTQVPKYTVAVIPRKHSDRKRDTRSFCTYLLSTFQLPGAYLRLGQARDTQASVLWWVK